MCYYFGLRRLFLLSLPRMFGCTSQSWQIYSAVSLPLSTHLGNTTNSTQGFPIATSVPPSSRQADINTHIYTASLRSRALSLRLGPASKWRARSCRLPPIMDRDEEGTYSCLTSTNKRRKLEARKGKGSGVPTRQPHIPVHRSMTR